MESFFHRLNRLFALGMLAAGVFACVFFTWFGLDGIANEHLLQEQGLVADAVVTAIRRDTRSENKVGHEIRYRFILVDDGTPYSYTDNLGRRDLWYSPSPEEWDRVREINRIRIVYLPDDPWINHPEDRHPMVDLLAATAMGPMAGVLCLMGIGVYIKRKIRFNYYRDTLRPGTVDAIVQALQRIQSKEGGYDTAVFLLGETRKHRMQCVLRAGTHILFATTADHRPSPDAAALTMEHLSRLKGLGWSRPSLRNPGGYHRTWWSKSEEDRRRIACELMQTFHEAYGGDIDLVPEVQYTTSPLKGRVRRKPNRF
jgi:hypothetical protein